MGNDVSKIERLGLADRVHQLMVDEGIATGRAIGRILRKEGHAISDAAVNRYLSKVGRVAGQRAERIIQEHVDKVVPEDLDALEKLEALTLKWSNEDPEELADRLAGVRAAIEFELDEWRKLIEDAVSASDRSKKNIAVGNIIKRCLGYLLKDERLQDKRLKAMGMVVKIIELKLSKAGLLKDDGRGRIIVVDASKEYDPDETGADKKDRRQALVVKFGRKDAPAEGTNGS
jgi:hypothetical protein